MSEVDLIPEDYRQVMCLRRFVRSFFIAFSVVVLLVSFGKGLLNLLVAREKSATVALEAGKTSVVSQRAELEKLRARQAELQERLAILESLRGGPPAERMFEIINRAVNESVWFTSLKFNRAPEGLAVKGPNADPAFFRAGPTDENRGNSEQQGRIRLEISGQALNHSALANLVKRFLDQQEIEDVHIVNTSTLHYPAGQVVAYNLVVLINSRELRPS